MTASAPPAGAGSVSLVVRRLVHAPAARVFAAWTEPEHLKKWWGPTSVVCTGAEVDLRVGGRYRIANSFPDGQVVWIAGAFEVVEPPSRLIYSWALEGVARTAERVTVRFEPRGQDTEVVVVHDRIPDAPTRAQHEQGWLGCLDGLDALLASP
jgi:uncharacterized protein YndB with AHSA1/START domain